MSDKEEAVRDPNKKYDSDEDKMPIYNPKESSEKSMRSGSRTCSDDDEDDDLYKGHDERCSVSY